MRGIKKFQDELSFKMKKNISMFDIQMEGF